jgi:hypothetical protein
VGTLGAGLLGTAVGVGEQVDLLAQAVDLGLARGTLVLELRLYLAEPLLELLELLAILLRAAGAGLELLAPGLLGGELVAQLAEPLGVGGALLLELLTMPRGRLGE